MLPASNSTNHSAGDPICPLSHPSFSTLSSASPVTSEIYRKTQLLHCLSVFSPAPDNSTSRDTLVPRACSTPGLHLPMEETPQPRVGEDDQDLGQNGEVSLPSTSRKRPAPVADDAPSRQVRKRAPTACHTCKSRKVKCSNDRPQCVGCARLGCDCVYPEQNYGAPERLDSAVPLILRSLNEILDRLPPRNDTANSPASITRDEPSHASQGPASSTAPDTTSNTSQFRRPRPASPAVYDEPSEYTATESLFRWPIFANTSASKWSRDTLFIADQDPGHNDVIVQTRGTARLPPVNDVDDVILLVKQFLRHVHIKNPILDGKSLLADARLVAETGPLWDTRSCLVLLAAALGAIAAPFDSTNMSLDVPLSSSSHDLEARIHGETYYHSARRRFGLLDRTIASCQCHLLSGIYLMYTLRPIQAWQAFTQASSVYIVYLKSSGRLSSEGNQWIDTKTESLRSLEQRLYWSCLKSEMELTVEIPLPPSSLSSINYPHMFPSPPAVDVLHPSPGGFAGFSSSTLMGASPQSVSTTSSNSMDHALLYEQSWFYYLTEISLLRLSQRITQQFYTTENSSWLRGNALDMINAALDFERQLEAWRESLPVPIRFWDSSLAPDRYTELHIATWGRYSKLKRLMYRPFLYRFVHTQGQDVLLNHAIRSFAEKCVDTCLDPIWAVGFTHRHHGSWFRCREATMMALILFAGMKSGLIKSMDRQMEAEYYIQIAINHLKYWEKESQDLQLARQILEMMCIEEGILGSDLG
ncbi:hypothetical protein B0T10DRAFT_606588 [Thelonectria olida]|uniref:Zn(2)-C6 fungal-type domain-containing protein n=1 Tax=Thelonectria olida TaxID=1576542 RepID=A0A9P8W645_9HYPO|nr:hypothetical protein B0T10DRAFT_606588 [Thelonectria olida]